MKNSLKTAADASGGAKQAFLVTFLSNFFVLRKTFLAAVCGSLLCTAFSGTVGATEFQSLPTQDWRDGAPPSEPYIWQALPVSGDVLPQPLFNIPIPDHPRIQKNLDYFQDDEGRAWLEACLTKSRPYRDFIFHQLEEYSVPTEFFYLGAVESDFSTTAVSRAGAVGMWQFMKNSIGGYDMRVTPYIDERKDFWKSTIGAIRKIKDNYNYYGDWYLALAAYNAGTPRIDLAIRRSGGIRDYWVLADKGFLPRETSAYIPQILAIVKLTSSLTKSGLPMNWDDGQVWDRVPIDKPVDLRMLAEAAQIPVDQLLAANRELKYPITPSSPLPYHLKVPAAWAPQIKTALENPDLKLIRYYFYTVRRGDTLSEVCQWYGISIAMVEKYNPGIDPDSLRIGQTLIVPALKDVEPFQRKTESTENKVSTEGVPAIPLGIVPGSSVYVVQSGDTLNSIARKMGTSAPILAGLNRITLSTILAVGQKLALPAQGRPIAP